MNDSRQAFTLIETMVALAIFALVIVGCVKAIEAIGGVVAGLRMEGEVRRSLENHAAELRALRIFPPKSPRSAAATNGIVIRDEVIQIEDADVKIKPEDNLFQVRMVASWKETGRAESLTITFYLRGSK